MEPEEGDVEDAVADDTVPQGEQPGPQIIPFGGLVSRTMEEGVVQEKWPKHGDSRDGMVAVTLWDRMVRIVRHRCYASPQATAGDLVAYIDRKHLRGRRHRSITLFPVECCGGGIVKCARGEASLPFNKLLVDLLREQRARRPELGSNVLHLAARRT